MSSVSQQLLCIIRCLLLLLVTALSASSAAGPLVFSVAEQSAVGTVIGRVSQYAEISQAGRPVVAAADLRYRIRSSAASSQRRYFDLDELTGVLRTAAVLDREELCPYEPFCQLVVDVIGTTVFHVSAFWLEIAYFGLNFDDFW